MTNTKTILGFIAGASIGAIVAILLSPEKGSDTRRRIADKTTDLGTAVKDFVVDFIKGGKKEAVNGTHNNAPKMNLNTMG